MLAIQDTGESNTNQVSEPQGTENHLEETHTVLNQPCGVSLWLQCVKPLLVTWAYHIGALVQVLTSLLLIQHPLNALEKAAEDG